MKKIILSLVAFTMMGTTTLSADEGNTTVVNMENENVVEATTEGFSAEHTLGLNVGTVGIGIEASFPLTPSLSIRASLNGASYSDTIIESDVEYDVSGNLLIVGALLDYYPVDDSQFHLSAGAFYNGNGIDGVGRPTSGTYEINNISYSASDIGELNAEFSFTTIAPYVGLGWGYRSMEHGWGFSLDLGALYQGSPSVAMDATRGSGIPADNGGPNDVLFAQLQSDVAEEQKALESEISDFSWYPIIRIGVTYTF